MHARLLALAIAVPLALSLMPATAPARASAPAGTVQLNQAPAAHQLFARNPATNRATVAVAGTVTRSGVGSVRAEVTRDSDGSFVSSTTVTVSGSGSPFALSPQLTAGLESYTVSLYAGSILQASWNDLVAGDAYLVNG